MTHRTIIVPCSQGGTCHCNPQLATDVGGCVAFLRIAYLKDDIQGLFTFELEKYFGSTSFRGRHHFSASSREEIDEKILKILNNREHVLKFTGKIYAYEYKIEYVSHNTTQTPEGFYETEVISDTTLTIFTEDFKA